MQSTETMLHDTNSSKRRIVSETLMQQMMKTASKTSPMSNKVILELWDAAHHMANTLDEQNVNFVVMAKNGKGAKVASDYTAHLLNVAASAVPEIMSRHREHPSSTYHTFDATRAGGAIDADTFRLDQTEVLGRKQTLMTMFPRAISHMSS